MKSIFKLIRRFVMILMLSMIGLLVVNVVLFISLTHQERSSPGGWTMAEELGELLTETEDGEWMLPEEGKEMLSGERVWAVLIEDGTGDVIWHSDDLPGEIPLHYSVGDISWGTRGYIEDYPTTTAARGDDLLILGHPKDRYWKSLYNTWDYKMIAGAPKMLGITLLVNFLVIVLIYVKATSGVLRQVKPIVVGIEALPEGKEVYVREKGLLSDMAAAINRVSEKLRIQDRELRKRETARANWISGVSHDIRTPLSMVMGYAGQLEEDPALSGENRRKAGVIRLQSIRMKNLVNDLNLVSKLEYNMQPVRRECFHLVSVMRKTVVEFINADLEGKYPMSWKTAEHPEDCMIEGDQELMRRAVSNLILNAQIHNPEGCHIFIEVRKEEEQVQVAIEDDGIGVTDEKLDELQHKPHYLMNDGSTAEQRHGLGLLIVKQIVEAHHGTVTFGHGREGGFRVQILLQAAVPRQE